MKKIYYGRAVYDKKEINAVINVLKNDSLSLIDGKKVKTLEKKISQIFGKKYGLMVNSGSSANLLALSSFKFKKGSEIITPNLTFSTTVAPIYQLGLIPHFVGAEVNKFLTDANQIEKCINNKTVALMIPNLLGNIAEWKKIYKIAKKYNLRIIEDSADTIGYTVNKKNLGGYSDIPVCVNYNVDGDIISEMPASLTKYRSAKPVYKNLPGWNNLDLDKIDEGYDSFPYELKKYVDFIENEIECPIKIISVGPQRHETIIR